MATRKFKSSLDWEYCECGCHSSYVEIGGLSYYIMSEFDSKYNVTGVWFNRHHPGRYGVLLPSMEEVEKRIYSDLQLAADETNRAFKALKAKLKK